MMKKGFTLIELLAVIVILAVIALITTPIIMNLVGNARKKAAEYTLNGIKDEAKLLYQTAFINGEVYNKIEVDFSKTMEKDGTTYPETKIFTQSNPNGVLASTPFAINGAKPTGGKVTILNDGTIIYQTITVGSYNCIIYDDDKTLCLGPDDKYDGEVKLQFASRYFGINQYAYENEITKTYSNTIDIPAVMTMSGYNPIGWDFNGDGSYDSKTDTLNAAIVRALVKDDKTIQIDPVLELQNDYYEVTVINGTGGGTYRTSANFDVVADAAPEGKKFSHWLQDGTLISYNSTQTFIAYKNVIYEAVYVDESVVVDKKGTATIISATKNIDDKKLIFASFLVVPSGYTINKGGVVATDNATIGTDEEQFTAANARFERYSTPSGGTYRYTWTKTNVNPGDTWYVRAYLVYTDLDGVSHTIYGDIVSQTF